MNEFARTDSNQNEVAIATHGLTKTYSTVFGRKKVHALRGIDIEVKRGEIVGILGPNGAGKTTLLKILLGIVSPTSGSAELFSQPINEASSRSKLGYLPENHRFPPYLTARQTLDVYGRLSNLASDVRAERIPRMIEEAGLAAWIDVRVGKFSKGMMQRLGLAQALLSDPDIIVLDEPTDGVDPVGRREIRDRLRALRASGKTILINSHLLSEIEMICDRVAIMNKGTIIRSGSIDDIVTEGSGWRIQVRGLPDSVDLSRFELESETRGQDTEFLFEKGGAGMLNELIDEIRSVDATIISVERHRRSLEAGFLDIIESEQGTQI